MRWLTRVLLGLIACMTAGSACSASELDDLRVGIERAGYKDVKIHHEVDQVGYDYEIILIYAAIDDTSPGGLEGEAIDIARILWFEYNGGIDEFHIIVNDRMGLEGGAEKLETLFGGRSSDPDESKPWLPGLIAVLGGLIVVAVALYARRRRGKARSRRIELSD